MVATHEAFFKVCVFCFAREESFSHMFCACAKNYGWLGFEVGHHQDPVQNLMHFGSMQRN